MDFTMTDEQKALRDAVRGVLRRHGSPAAEDGRSAAPPPHDATLWEALVEVGVPALAWAEDDGGVGAGITDLAVVATELGRARLQVPLAETLVAGTIVGRLATDETRREILGALSEGSALPLPALDEPLRRWSPTPTDVTATEGPDSWTLSGTKAPVRYAPAATHLVVSAATPDGSGLFLVERPEVATEEVVLDGTPATRLGEGPQADRVLREALSLGAVLLCHEAVGAMDEALRLTSDYLNTREQFGVPLARFQTLTQRAADMYVELELARSSALYAAMTADDEPEDVDTVLRTRVVVDRAARHIGREAIQLHGGIGVTAEYAVGHLATRLADITRTWGDSRTHLSDLATRIADHGSVDVLA